MANLLLKMRSNPALWRKGTMALVMVGATVAAFYWGRMGGTTVEAQQVQARVGAVGQPGQAQSDYSRRVVAYLYENMPISREELGEYLIARFGQERIDFLINRRIVEMACQAKGIYVTDLEVDAQFKEELKGFPNMTAQDFYNQILKRFNKSLYEWKEDVIRPKLMLSKLCRPMVEVTQQDLANAFEARYGPKVECRMIAFQKGDKHMQEVWTKISQGEAEFAAYATQQFLENLLHHGWENPAHPQAFWRRENRRGRLQFETRSDYPADGNARQHLHRPQVRQAPPQGYDQDFRFRAPGPAQGNDGGQARPKNERILRGVAQAGPSARDDHRPGARG